MNLKSLYQRFCGIADYLQSPLLLVVRLFWGWQFMLTGWGKLVHLDKTTEYFASLHLPLPQVNAAAAGATECLGGILLMLGLYSRAAGFALTVVMLVAYATADQEALHAIFSDPDKFTGASPFLFLFAALLVLAFGSGAISVDRLILGFGSNKVASSSAGAKSRK